jgi:glucosamine--fructose-6-phosphate aminotransferase (isomerizing)
MTLLQSSGYLIGEDPRVTSSLTKMKQEIAEIPSAVDRLLTSGDADIKRISSELRDSDLRCLLSVARGSSDHACTYLKYAAELLLGLPMASVGPSLASVYGASLKADGMLCFSVSQSGKSPDITRMTRSLTKSGATTLAITNHPGSPLSEAASATVPIHAGPELSVAATKTFVTSLVAGLWLLAELKADTGLLAAIRNLPAHLKDAVACDWREAAPENDIGSLFTLGRGPSWAVSNEAALKFKETCQIHAESYSSAEVLHGPVSIVSQGFPVIAFAAADAAEQAVVDVADKLSQMGAAVFVNSEKAQRANVLPIVRTDHWLTDPIASIVSFYGLVEHVAGLQGINPDASRHLNKVTETV